MEGNNEKHINQARELEVKVSELKFELEELKTLLEEEQNQREFYQFVADFTFGWELWLEPGGKIKYCSPSCFDLTGFTANQIMDSEGISELLVYEPDREKFTKYCKSTTARLRPTVAIEPLSRYLKGVNSLLF